MVVSNLAKKDIEMLPSGGVIVTLMKEAIVT